MPNEKASWISYLHGRPQLKLKVLFEQFGDNLNCIRLSDENITTGNMNTEIVRLVHHTIIMPLETNNNPFHPGLHHITLSVQERGESQEHWLYIPHRAVNDRYKVVIEKKIVGQEMKLHIKTPVTLKKGRLYYLVDNYPFRFSFDQIKKDMDHYFLLKKPEHGRIEFRIDESDLKDKDIFYPDQCKDLGIGIVCIVS